MTRVIERRQAAAPGETVLELRFFRTRKNAEVRAYISCDDVIIDMDIRRSRLLAAGVTEPRKGGGARGGRAGRTRPLRRTDGGLDYGHHNRAKPQGEHS